MADYYVYSGAAGAGTGADWANAFTTLAAALSGKSAGDRFFVADDHSETTAGAVTLTFPGTAASPNIVLCVLRSGGSVPPASADMRTTAVLEYGTGGSALASSGSAYIYGVTVTGIRSQTWAANSTNNLVFDACALRITGGTNQLITFGSAGTSGGSSLVMLNNTVLEFASAGGGLVVHGKFLWDDTSSAIAGTVPTTLLKGAITRQPSIGVIRGVDLSAMGSGNNIVDLSTDPGIWSLTNCKLGASVSVATGTIPDAGGGRVTLVNCDSADTNYRYYKQWYQGTITHETTIVRTGGASDGTTGISRKMVSTANAKFFSPMVSDPIEIWNETLSALTATVEVVTDGVTLKDNEAWLEVEYLGTSGFPIASFASDRAADILATGANQTSSSETWTTTGLSSPVKQTLSVTFTPAEKGLIRFRVCLAKASTTMYFDPEINGLGFTSGRQYQAPGAYVNEGAAGGGGGGSGAILIGGGRFGVVES